MTAMDRLATIERQQTRIIELLEQLTGQQVEPPAVVVEGDRRFIPGTGWTGTQTPEDDGPCDGPTTPAGVRAALAEARRHESEEP